MSSIPLCDTVYKREKGEVASHADIKAWMDFSTSLAHEDIACTNNFATKFFDAEAFALAIATIS